MSGGHRPPLFFGDLRPTRRIKAVKPLNIFRTVTDGAA